MVPNIAYLSNELSQRIVTTGTMTPNTVHMTNPESAPTILYNGPLGNIGLNEVTSHIL